MASRGGGACHVRYAHAWRPRDLEVACPRCAGLAVARKASEVEGPALVGDLAPSWSLDDWSIACTSCSWRASGASYADLPACFWAFEAGGLELWAWNREHLAFVRSCLAGEDVAHHRYARLAAYVPRDWKANAQRVAKAMEERLAR